MKIDKDEKRRIYETEIIRLKARRDFEKEKSGGGWLWVIVVLILVTGGFFLVRQIGGPSRLMGEVDQIIESAEDPSRQGMGKIWERFATLLEAQDDPAALESLVREAREATDRLGVDVKDFRAECYWMAETGALLRLGELGTDDAAAALVALLADEQLSWDGEAALNIAHAISVCGKACIPYLAEVPADHPRFEFADELIPFLQRGEIIE